MKKILSLFLAIMLVVSLITAVPVFAATQSGTVTGTSITWSYDDSAKIFTLSGTGATPHAAITTKGVTSSIATTATKIVVDEGITELGYNTFLDFRKVTDIEFPSTLAKIQAGVFINWNAFSGTFTIPKTVTYLGGYPWQNNSKIKSVVFEGDRSSELKLIKETFKSMSGLTSVYLPENVTIDTEKVTSVADLFGGTSVPANVTIWAENQEIIEIFEGFDDYESSGILVSMLPEGVDAYGGIPGLPKGYWTFTGDTLDIYGNGEWTGSYYANPHPWSELDYTTIKKVVFHNGIKSIASNFAGRGGENLTPAMSAIEEVVFPNTLVTIKSFAFGACSKLTDISYFNAGETTTTAGLPEEIETLEQQAFQGCPLNPTYGNALLLPASLKILGNNAFCNNASNSGFSVVSFEEGSQLESIGTNAFLNVKCLKTIVIPETVVSIGANAFMRNTTDSFEVYFEGIPASIDSTAFATRSNVSLYCFHDNFPQIGGLSATKLNKAGSAVKITNETSVDVVLTMPYDGIEGVLSTGGRVTVNASKSTSENKLPANFSGGTEVSGITAEVAGNHSVKLRGIPAIEDGEKLVVTLIDAKDAQGNAIDNSTVVLYKGDGDVGLISAEFFDGNGGVIEVTGTEIEAGTKKMVFHSVDATDKNIQLCDSNGTSVATATFADGVYTIELSGALTPGVNYTLKRNGEEYIVFTTDAGKVSVGKITVSGSNAEFDYYNSSNDPTKIYVMMSDGTLCKEISIGKGENGTYSDTKSTDTDMFVTDGLDTLKILATDTETQGAVSIDKDLVSVSGTPFDSNRTVTFTGELGVGKHKFGVVIFKSAVTKTAGDVVFVDMVTTDSDGKFTLPVQFSEAMGTDVYSVFMCDGEGIFYKNTKLAYAKKADTEAAFTLINNAAKTQTAADDVYDVIKENTVVLEFIYDVYDNTYADNSTKKIAYEKKVAALIANEIQRLQANGKTGFTYAEKEDALKKFREASIAAAFSEGQISNISDVETDISVLLAEPAKTWYNEKAGVAQEKTDSWKLGITQRLSNVQFTSIDDFSSKLKAAFIFSIVKNPAGTASLKEALLDFGTEIKGNTADFNPTTEITEKACVGLINAQKDYSGFDYTALINDIKAYNKTNLYPEGGNGGNGGGSGSGSGGGFDGSMGSVTIAPELVDTTTPTVKKGFTDIENYDWAKDAILALREKGIINGKSESVFAPEDNVLREEFTKMIVKIAVPENVTRTMTFDDVNTSDWYYEYIRDAYGCGIINGVSENLFGAGNAITRQDMCVIIANALKLGGKTATTDGELDFADSEKIADYAKDAVAMLAELGIVNGYDDNTFRPSGFATRAEAAKMIYSMLKNM